MNELVPAIRDQSPPPCKICKRPQPSNAFGLALIRGYICSACRRKTHDAIADLAAKLAARKAAA